MDNSEKNIINLLEKRIGIIMRIGVIVTAVFMFFGFILFAVFSENFAEFQYINLLEIFKGLFYLNPYSYMLTGIFLLILTPAIRVLASIFLFAKQKDVLYAVITALVFIILIVSFFVGLIIR